MLTVVAVKLPVTVPWLLSRKVRGDDFRISKLSEVDMQLLGSFRS